MKNFRVTVNGKSYDVSVEELGNTAGSPAAVKADQGNPAPPPKTQASQNAPAPKPQPAEAQGNNAVTKVTSPMPGVILDLKVAKGDTVSEGSTVLVLEAMKMENEISAPCSGVVKDILVTKGASVNTDDLLITIE